MTEMNLNKLGYLGELNGGIALIASLIFVGLQIRQNTRALRLSQYREIHNGLRESLSTATADAKVAEIVLRDIADLSSLDPVERYRFDMVFLG